MVHSQSIYDASLLCCSFSAVFTELDFSKIEEEMLLNTPQAGISLDMANVYSRVRKKTFTQPFIQPFIQPWIPSVIVLNR